MARKNKNGQNGNGNQQQNQDKTKCGRCGKLGHVATVCRTNLTNQNQNRSQDQNQDQNKKQKQNQNAKFCGNCGAKNHHPEKCYANKAVVNNFSAFNGPLSLMRAEELWCKWCNSRLHRTARCENREQQWLVKLDTDMKPCEKCHYRGHSADVCCNPWPEQLCWMCNQPGHSSEDCLCRELPEVRKLIKNDPISPSSPEAGSRHELRLQKATSDLKRKNQVIRQTRETYNNFIKDLVQAATQESTVERLTITENELINIMPQVLDYYPGQPWDIEGTNVSEVVAKMQEFHIVDNCTFWGLKYAIRRLEAGYTVHCAVQGCNAHVAIVDTNFNFVTQGSHSGFDARKTEHAVFLVYDCNHQSHRNLEWRRQCKKEVDTTALLLLQQAHSNPLFERYANIRSGLIGVDTADSDVDELYVKTQKPRKVLQAKSALSRLDDPAEMLAKVKAIDMLEARRRAQAAAVAPAKPEFPQVELGYTPPAPNATGFGVWDPMPLDTPFLKRKHSDAHRSSNDQNNNHYQNDHHDKDNATNPKHNKNQSQGNGGSDKEGRGGHNNDGASATSETDADTQNPPPRLKRNKNHDNRTTDNQDESHPDGKRRKKDRGQVKPKTPKPKKPVVVTSGYQGKNFNPDYHKERHQNGNKHDDDEIL